MCAWEYLRWIQVHLRHRRRSMADMRACMGTSATSGLFCGHIGLFCGHIELSSLAAYWHIIRICDIWDSHCRDTNHSYVVTCLIHIWWHNVFRRTRKQFVSTRMHSQHVHIALCVYTCSIYTHLRSQTQISPHTHMFHMCVYISYHA